MKDKIKALITILIILAGIFFIASKLLNDKQHDIDEINKDFKFTKGIVIKKVAYKGHFIDVRYYVNGKEYISSDGFNSNQSVEEGDSVKVKYSVLKPEIMITEFNDKY